MSRQILLCLLIVAAMCLLPLFPSLAVVPDDQPYLKPVDVLEQLLNDAAPGTPPPMVARTRQGETLPIRDLDDPSNPYRGQYAAWDTWLFENYQHDFDPSLYGGG